MEPSVGLILSRVNVDSANVGGSQVTGIKGVFFVNQIKNSIGRAGLRVGTTYEFGDFILEGDRRRLLRREGGVFT